MKKILDTISGLGINSFSELRYVNRKAMNWLLGILLGVLVLEGFLFKDEKLIISAFFLWFCLAVAARYKEYKLGKIIHFASAGLFFVLLVLASGPWVLLLPSMALVYLFYCEHERDIHVLVFEVLLFMAAQIGILYGS